MKVTFSYAPASGGFKAEPLALGNRLSPLAPVTFSHIGVVQSSHPVRASAQTFFPRGGGYVTETFTVIKEHTTFWAGMVWVRIELGRMRGSSGTLLFEGNASEGRITLVGAVCTSARGNLLGATSFVEFTFVGGSWTSA